MSEKQYDVVDKKTNDIAIWNTKINRDNENNPVVIKIRPMLLKKIQEKLDFDNATDFLKIICKSLKVETTTDDYDFTNPKPEVQADSDDKISNYVAQINKQVTAQLKANKTIDYEQLTSRITAQSKKDKLTVEQLTTILDKTIPEKKNEISFF